MKPFVCLLMVILIAATTIRCNGNEGDNSARHNSEYFDYEGNFHEDIIVPQVKAWKEVAKVMYPNVCDDTETEWAADHVDSLATVLINGKDLNPLEQLARLYHIEIAACYGMEYVSAILGASFDMEVSNRARMAYATSVAYLDSLKKYNYNDLWIFTDYQATVYYNYSYFMILATGFYDKQPEFVTQNISMNQEREDEIHTLYDDLHNGKSFFQHAELVFNSYFFLTFSPLTFWLGGSEFLSQPGVVDKYTTIAAWFDKYANPIIKSINDGKASELKALPAREFSELLRQSAQYRAELISLLAKAISYHKPVNQIDSILNSK